MYIRRCTYAVFLARTFVPAHCLPHPCVNGTTAQAYDKLLSPTIARNLSFVVNGTNATRPSPSPLPTRTLAPVARDLGFVVDPIVHPTPSPTPRPKDDSGVIQDKDKLKLHDIGVPEDFDPKKQPGVWPYRFHAFVSDQQVAVGDLDLFRKVWSQVYAMADHDGVQYKDDEDSWVPECYWDDDNPTLKVTTQLQAIWGTLDPLPWWAVRDFMLKAMWSAVQHTWQETEPAYHGCRGAGQNEAMPNAHDGAVCGNPNWPTTSGKPFHGTWCPCQNLYDWAKTETCDTKRPTHTVPNVIVIRVYDASDRLLTPYMSVDFTTRSLEPWGKCGRLNAIVEAPIVAATLWEPYLSTIVLLMMGIYCRTDPRKPT